MHIGLVAYAPIKMTNFQGWPCIFTHAKLYTAWQRETRGLNALGSQREDGEQVGQIRLTRYRKQSRIH